MEGTVRAAVNPTESREKVVEAVRNVLGDIELEQSERGGLVVLEGRLERIEDLAPLRDAFARMRIRDAARSLFTRIAEEGFLSFGLNKQAAYAGRVSFYSSGESSLGPIQVTLKGDVSEAITYLCNR
ncbi:hypothetical protein E3J20_00310 [Candidatus Bathyarchaeota archaeon]|nr:MAG: hypothetical protein E3J20_00310 [Candidatus Bathyarchaeota archaeon]